MLNDHTSIAKSNNKHWFKQNGCFVSVSIDKAVNILTNVNVTGYTNVTIS